MKYYVYQLIDPRSNTVFYVGKGTGNRAYTHNEFRDGNNNFYKDNIIKKLHQQGLEPTVEIVEHFANEQDAYNYEDKLIETIGIDNLTNITEGARPPSKLGWTPSEETLAKRSASLKGIERTEEWRVNLSKSKSGANNPRHGIKEPCTEERRLAVLRGKNAPNYDLYKKAIGLMDNGKSADAVSKELSVGRGVCFKLKNRTHGFFQAFPELI
jgi:hypothetical protein